jgi:hypothetical protein
MRLPEKSLRSRGIGGGNMHFQRHGRMSTGKLARAGGITCMRVCFSGSLRALYERAVLPSVRALTATLICHAPAGERLGYSNDSGAARAFGCEDNDDLHARAEQRWPRSKEPGRSALGNGVSGLRSDAAAIRKSASMICRMTSQALPLIRLGHLVKGVATYAVPFRGVLQTHDLLQWQVVLPPLSSMFSLSTIELAR